MTIRRPQPASTTTVSSRYQTVIPADIREKLCIREGSRIAWIIKDDTIEVVPMPEKPWRQLQDAGKGKDYLGSLAQYRRQERAKAGSGEAKSNPPNDEA
jgi:AbrB family looped-hinge helix DNA binding protein